MVLSVTMYETIRVWVVSVRNEIAIENQKNVKRRDQRIFSVKIISQK